MREKTKKLRGWDFKSLIVLLIIFFFIFLRFNSNNWDQGTHQHPDERMAIMVSMRLNLFDNLDPDFFNYGSLPFYVLRGTAQLMDSATGFFQGDRSFNDYSSYDQLLVVGRIISTLMDAAVIIVVYHISYYIFKKRDLALLSALIYSASFFAIQNSNFYIVDHYVNLFSSLLFLSILRFWNKKTIGNTAILGVLMGILLASKFTPIIYLPAILLVVVIRVFGSEFNFLIKDARRNCSSNIKKIIKKRRDLILQIKKISKAKIFQCFILISSFLSAAFLTFLIFMPYGVIRWEQFLTEIGLQLKMNSNPYIFPYTLQYVSTLPYLYYLKNIFLWGFGPINFFLFVVGFFSLIKFVLNNYHTHRKQNIALLITLYSFLNIYYFLVIGRSAVKFMRYMLPLYPFMAVVAAWGLFSLLKNISTQKNKKIFSTLVLSLSIIWTLSFYRIYLRPNTRITATNWIRNNIPAGSVLAVEHWDDRLPLFYSQLYKFVELPLYNLPDDDQKKREISQSLEEVNYLILASNRLYDPLTRLRDCDKYKKCYPITAQYYNDLFSGELTFAKVAEFTNYPTIPFFNISIIDDRADESFTVYDHPKIMIFKKVEKQQ
ncbi:MAG: tetratricopeptide TPR_4 [Microgenomates bacterium 39_6]|nr:MAG: tetratricopeptide TPR_4 [Microgenomates bacterium 39_6]